MDTVTISLEKYKQLENYETAILNRKTLSIEYNSFAYAYLSDNHEQEYDNLEVIKKLEQDLKEWEYESDRLKSKIKKLETELNNVKSKKWWQRIK